MLTNDDLPTDFCNRICEVLKNDDLPNERPSWVLKWTASCEQSDCVLKCTTTCEIRKQILVKCKNEWTVFRHWCLEANDVSVRKDCICGSLYNQRVDRYNLLWMNSIWTWLTSNYINLGELDHERSNLCEACREGPLAKKTNRYFLMKETILWSFQTIRVVNYQAREQSFVCAEVNGSWSWSGYGLETFTPNGVLWREMVVD